ncbi:uncharacterized protein LOC128386233 [Panonychus citri]|uniref:uncharacterized protein LOC128386233 n=1 Tax=Panonychus citri TaxID=50023 RepID=UPI002306E46D|nr:uncharacterized protein LOC128386233 [Panonychus citri]
MKIMAKLYKEMFIYNQYWSVVNGFGHCMSFMINSYILYPIFFIPSTVITRLIYVYWTILCLFWFAFPYLTVSYMNFKISRVNRRIFSKIKDLANPFEGIRLMVTMEHISEFKGFSIFTFHEPSYISFVFQSLDLITYFCLFIQNLGYTHSAG